jgi:RNA recognition motif-containing protein
MKEYCGQFGTVVDAIMPRDRDTGRSRGFGFVTFSSAEGADAALGEPHHELDGRQLNMTAATPERIDPNAVGGETKRLYIGDLLSTTTDEEFKAAFGVFGPMEVLPIFFCLCACVFFF